MNQPRLKEKYEKEIAPLLMTDFGIKNKMAVPRLEKISINVGVGKISQKDSKSIDQVAENIAKITGQKPFISKSKKAIAGFKLREGLPVGVAVTLRGKRMYEFLDRLVSVALPRVRDFRGLSLNGFDKQGNFSLGVTEHIVFPEIIVEGISDITHGLQINITMKGSGRDAKIALLRHFGFPFKD